jgi:hypothetical protein
MRRFTSKLHRIAAMVCALLLLCALCAPAVSARSLAEGTIEQLEWDLTNGILTIRGEGAIPDYTERNPAPWHKHRESILRLDLDYGITAIGSMAFYECTALVSVDLPLSVKTVGDMAFAGCESLMMVRLPKVTSLGRYAFSRCFALSQATLPDTLATIGDYAFYRCESLAYIRIPASVKTLGGSAFAYCSGLLRVDVGASIAALPEWCFYGCERLTALVLPAAVKTAGDSALTRCDALDTVYYDGTDAERQTLSETIAQSLPGFTVSQLSSTSAVSPDVEHKDVIVEGDTSQEITTEITQKEDVVIRVEQTITSPVTDGAVVGDPERFDSTIHVSFGNEAGWDTLMDTIRDQIDDKTSFESNYGEQAPVQAQVTLQNNKLPLSGAWLNDLAGRDVIVTVTVPDGSRFTINGTHIAGYEFEESYRLSYSLKPETNPAEDIRNVVGTATCYWLSFDSAFAFPITVDVLLDPYAINQNATLYEKVPNANLLKLQSVRVDESGYVSFRLRNINTSTRYLLAVNVAGTPPHEILVPDQVPGVEDFVPLDEKYAFSEPRGFFGMTMGEFTRLVLTVVGVFVGVVLVLALFLIINSKRKAKIAAIRAEVMGTDTLAEYDSAKKRTGKKK